MVSKVGTQSAAGGIRTRDHPISRVGTLSTELQPRFPQCTRDTKKEKNDEQEESGQQEEKERKA